MIPVSWLSFSLPIRLAQKSCQGLTLYLVSLSVEKIKGFKTLTIGGDVIKNFIFVTDAVANKTECVSLESLIPVCGLSFSLPILE